MHHKLPTLVIALILLLFLMKSPPPISEHFSEASEINDAHYVYWTGGYDSTFRLCELLINYQKTVQPIYINFNLDNDCHNPEECDRKLWLRRNRKQEKNAMKNIKKTLIEQFPHMQHLLLPTIFVDQDIDDELFNEQFSKHFYTNNLWPKKRKVHQYYFLAKYAHYHGFHIDTGVLGIHTKSKFYKYLLSHLVQTEGNWEIMDNESPIHYLNFPLFGRTKQMLLDKAKMFSYQRILDLTWSCWFPQNGKPCGKCPMCKERIINHPELSDIKKLELIETFEDPPVNLFWTGGFDSTFRLCQLLLEEKKQVQPIYISDPNIDNDPNQHTRRHSIQNEIDSMIKIRNYLHQHFPTTVNLMLPIKNIKKIHIDPNIKTNMKTLYQQNKVRRPICQYGAMAQVCKNLHQDIEVCIVNENEFTDFSKYQNTLFTALKGKLQCNYDFCATSYKRLKSNLNAWEKPLRIFKRFVFPLYHLTKQDMAAHARQQNYLSVLKLTWSCWYPLDNGQPCGKCIMCRERVI